MEIVSKAVAASDVLEVIDVEMTKASIQLERAECVAQDLTECYFNLPEITKENLWKLQAGYFEHATKTDIVFDYIFAASESLKKIGELVDQAIKELKASCII